MSAPLTSARPDGVDRRFWREANGVAHVSLQGQLSHMAWSQGTPLTVQRGQADLLAAPEGRLERQLPLGSGFTELTRHQGFSFGFETVSGYCGWIASEALGPKAKPANHWIALPLSHRYGAPQVKDSHLIREPLPMLAQVRVEEASAGFAQLSGEAGWVPYLHLKPLGQWYGDPVAVARMFLFTPYLWGGDSALGIDCSGLVHAARSACGLETPRDADLQEAMPGTDVAEGMEEPGDLIFWKGHVAMASGDGRMIHANGFHMAVIEEPILEAAQRIKAAGGGPITRRLRPAA